MPALGILAFGSLLDDPGSELAALVVERRPTRTPFAVEFARRSGTRGGAPTLVPVRAGGANVNAQVLVLQNDVSETAAADVLWRRETRQRIGSKERYRPSAPWSPDRVRVARRRNLVGVDTVLYTRITPNIRRRTPSALARLALSSARAPDVLPEHNGIAYLLHAKANGIATPLSGAYEAEILRRTNTRSLAEALKKARAQQVMR